MSKILVITTTVSQKEKSFSLASLNRFLKHYKELNPNDEIEIIDLNKVEIAQQTLNVNNIIDTYWNEDAMNHIKKLKEVDKLIIASPMHNFNIPAMLKNYIDHVALANETFSYKYSKKGDAIGLLTNLTLQILTTQGAPLGWYPWGNHTEYLRGAWNFMGANVKEPVLVHGVKTDPYNKMPVEEVIDQFDEQLKTAAKNF